MLDFKIESWVWYSAVMIIAISRFISRRMALGSFRRFQADEYIMMLTLAFYTVDISVANIVEHTSSNLLPPGYDIAHMTKQDIAERTFGSKLILVVESSQIVTVWGAKVCLLIMYMRLTTMRRENVAIKILFAYVAATFVIMEVLYFGVWCRPFHNYWAVPTPNVQCDAATNHLITNAVFNITSDVAMLVVGLPMFLRISIPMNKKIPLVGIFSLGVFVIIAAILNKVYSFSEPFSEQWVYWYVRESSTALIVANLPFVWLLYRKIFRISSTVGSHGRYTSSAPHDRAASKTHHLSSSPRARSSKHDTYRAASNSDASAVLEMHEVSPTANDLDGWGSNMTAEELLRGESLGKPVSKHATPFSHPALFYANAGARKNPTTTTCTAGPPARGYDDDDDDELPFPVRPAQVLLSESIERRVSRASASADDLVFGAYDTALRTDGEGGPPKAGSFV